MSRPRKSAAELKATSRHYTKEELDAREAGEPKAPAAAKVSPPGYLPVSLRKKFDELAAVLIPMGTLTQVDADTLARYLIAEYNYLRCTNRVTSAISAGDTTAADRWTAMQDRYFKQLRAGAADLGLNARARNGIRLPLPDDDTGDGALFGD